MTVHFKYILTHIVRFIVRYDKQTTNCPIFNGRIAISLAVLTVLLLSITTITTTFVNSGNFALAQSRTGPSISASLNDVRNNNTTKQIPPQQPGNNNKIYHHYHQFLDNHKKSMNIH